MLRVEDCKPGVEVIAIRNTGSTRKPQLDIGTIYTICDFLSVTLNDNDDLVTGGFISLMEIESNETDVGGWAYGIECFKLRDKEELIKLFNLNEIKIMEPA